jgi:hypothetical protein
MIILTTLSIRHLVHLMNVVQDVNRQAAFADFLQRKQPIATVGMKMVRWLWIHHLISMFIQTLLEQDKLPRLITLDTVLVTNFNLTLCKKDSE